MGWGATAAAQYLLCDAKCKFICETIILAILLRSRRD